MKLSHQIICAVIGFQFIVPHQTLARSPVTSSTRTASLQVYDDRPIDPNAVKLPANYHGVNPAALWAKLSERKKSAQKKDEFETTEQFHQRVLREKTAPIFGVLTTESYIAFEMEITAAYDADLELMHVYVFPSTSKEVEFPQYAGKHFDAVIKMDIPTAKKSKTDLRALVVFRLQDPFIRDSYPDKERIVGQLFQVWFYSLSSGQVFVKKGAGESTDWPPNPRLLKANQLYQDGLYEDALAELRRLLTDEPMDGNAYLLIGRIHQDRGDLNAAISALRTAVFWEANLIDAHILLARIFLRNGDRAQATHYTRIALRIDPKNAEALTLLRQLEPNLK